MASDFVIKAHDQLPSIRAALTVKSTGQAVDLTDALGVVFILRTAGGGTVKVNAPAVVVSPPTAGLVRYDWATADTGAPGSYEAEWQVTWPGNKKQTFPTTSYHTVDVLADLDGA